MPDACRLHNISEQTYFRWKKKYGGMDVSEAARLHTLEEENSRLKRLVADQALDIQILKEVNSKKVVSPVQKKVVIETLCGMARACRLFGLARSAVNRKPGVLGGGWRRKGWWLKLPDNIRSLVTGR